MAGKSLWNSLLIACILFSFNSAVLPAASAQSGSPPPPTWRAQPLRLEDFPHFPSSTVPDETQSPAGPAAPDALADWSKIVFHSYYNDNWDIYRANGDGSAQTRLTTHSAVDVEPRINRGCTRIIFSSNRDGDYEIFSMNPDGTGLLQLTRNSAIYDEYPAWSPDGAKIAFQTDRDGQYEIYTMNTDGTGLVRLTTNSAYDGQPAWSPDGSRIAFSSDRGGSYHIWVMNADGSLPVQLSSQNYSSDAAWSPDGMRIAYSADGNDDGWSEIWWMYPDGTSQTFLWPPGGAHTDARVRSWSPDAQWIAYTRITWSYINDQWYWSTAYIESIRFSDILHRDLSLSPVNWFPDWQTCDTLPPTSSLNPLPENSPGKFPLSWSGMDAGTAGLLGFDIQVRDGSSGAWFDWLVGTGSTNRVYPGIGGHTYYFRSRARDNALNTEAWPVDYEAFTYVENQPPQSMVRQLPVFTPNGTAITWQGWDPGGSLIEKYDIQAYPASNPTWQDLLQNTNVPFTAFNGTPGERYFFRSKATDSAQNAEQWPQGDGDTYTTLYTWGMYGQVTDQMGLPVGGVVITTTPGSFAQYPVDHPGQYGAYVSQSAGSYAIDWDKQGYGDLPLSTYTVGQGGELDVVLPPLDNRISNGTFESGSLSTWMAGGTISPVISTQKHTGGYAALLGSRDAPAFTPLHNTYTAFDCYQDPKTALTPGGVLHVMCGGGNSQVSGVGHASREANGVWSDLQIVSTNEVAWDEGIIYYDFDVDQNGGVHLVWSTFRNVTNGDIFYRWRSPTGVWTNTVNLSHKPLNHNEQYLSDVSIAVDTNGRVHAVWTSRLPGIDDIYYTWRSVEGVWSVPENVTGDTYVSVEPRLSADPFGNAHLTWMDNRLGHYDLFYRERSAAGVWSVIINLTDTPNWEFNYKIVFDPFGNMHIAWNEDVGGSRLMYYRWRNASGRWSDLEHISSQGGFNNFDDMVVDESGRVRLLWKHERTMLLSTRAASGAWGLAERVYPDSNTAGGGRLGYSNGRLHMLFEDGSLVRYQRLDTDNSWSSVVDLRTSQYSFNLNLLLDQLGIAHAIWIDYQSSHHSPHYRGLAPAFEASQSVLSQQVTLSPDMTSPILSFLYQFSSGDPQPGSRFVVTVDDGSASTEVFSTAAYTNNWVHHWVDLSPWAGQTVTISFDLQQAAGVPFAWALLDDVTVGASHPDLWLYKNAVSPGVIPGQNAVFTLTYGNQGGASVASVRITDTLPAELAFVSASPAPVATTPSLVWDLPGLPPSSGPYTIQLTTTLTSTVPALSKVENHASIGPVTGELEHMNNASTEIVAAGQLLYFPIIQWR